MVNKFFKVAVYIFAIIGFVLVAGFFAVKFKLTNTSGIVDSQNEYFLRAAEESESIAYCRFMAIKKLLPENAQSIAAIYSQTKSKKVLDRMILTVFLQYKDDKNFSGSISTCLGGKNPVTLEEAVNSIQPSTSPAAIAFPWSKGEEWRVLGQAIRNDEKALNKAAADAGVDPRLIISNLIVEQLRLYYSNREIFKSVFSPLKLLGNQSQFSWGVMGIKQETAEKIEDNLKDKQSPFYPGPQFEHILDFKTSDHGQERFERLTNEKDHYYSYLYAALYMREVTSQWKNAGHDISDRPEIVSTLYNIGFDRSKPTADPKVGGAAINISGRVYSFGSLAHEFYYSGELAELFPYRNL